MQRSIPTMLAIDCLRCRKSTVGKIAGEVTTDFDESDSGIQQIHEALRRVS
jgi:hypothetical protein